MKSFHDGSGAGMTITRRNSMKAMVAGLGSISAGAKFAWGLPDDSIVRNAVSIHQEASFSVSPAKVYDVLTDPKKFQQVELLSGVMKAADLAAKPAEIGREPGSAFSLFGGYISGRQIELIPGKRVVQAWRTASWPEGIYSIARFELVDDGTGTNLIFDQAGFPAGEAEHLSSGWKANYWNAMSKFLSA
jgi:activator of HSP90 ATPase